MKAILSALVFLIVGTPAVGAQEWVTVRATSAIPDAVIEYVARASEPYELLIKAGEVPQERIRDICGVFTQTFGRVFLEHNRGFSWAAQSTPRVVNMLACFKWQLNPPPIRLLAGEKKLDHVLLRVVGVKGDAKVDCKLNDPPSKCNFTYKDLVQQLNPGRNLDELSGPELKLPLTTTLTSFPVRVGRSAEEVRTGIARLVDNANAAYALVENGLGSAISLLSSVASSDAACANPSAFAGYPWPYDAKGVKHALERTMRAAEQKNIRPAPATVTIIDTGFEENRFSPDFLRAFMRVNPRSDESRFGMGAFLKRVIKPDEGYEARLHGTQVADIVSGGSGLRGEFAQLSGLIDLNVVKLTQPGPSEGSFVIREDAINAGVSFARDRDSYVANMSIGSSKALARIMDVISGRRLILVVAAGNERRDLGRAALYPAIYSGLSDQIITVAAHDGRDDVAEFSNYSDKYTDLAAPGCAVPFSFQVEGDRLHGTSFAAPLVSMTVALLRAFRVEYLHVKGRLQSASDYLPGLVNKTRWAGKLNIPKALSLYEDVIELRSNGQKRLFYGKWLAGDNDLLNCEEGADDFAGNIVKISTIDSGSPYRIRYLHVDAAGALVARVCTPAGDWPGLQFEYADRPGSAQLIAWPDLQDYVKRYFLLDNLGGEGESGRTVEGPRRSLFGQIGENALR